MASLPRPESAAARAWRIVLYVVAVTVPTAAALAGEGSDLRPSLDLLGRCAPILAFGIVAVQLVLAARWLWVERPFGLDRVYRFHRAMGVVAAALLLSHPVLLALGGHGMELLTDLDAPWFIWVGKATLLATATMVLVALYRRFLRIEFEGWRRAHRTVAVLILIGGVVHAFNAGGDVQTALPRLVLLVYAVGALAAVAHAKASARRVYTVQSVSREAHNTWTVALKPPEGAPPPQYLPGQFHFVTFRAGRGLPREEHPFTISSDPAQPESVSSTIKASGDFTCRIGEIESGDLAAVSPPYGRFSYLLHPEETRLVFIAAGIGITPLMSMIRHMRSTGAECEVLLLYGNRAEEDIIFGEELAAIAAADPSRLRVVHILSRPSAAWTGETGRVDREKIKRLCGDVAGKGFYVCGPTEMMRAVIRALRKLGVPASRIHYEYFAL
jgi:predicted ferric reductase